MSRLNLADNVMLGSQQVDKVYLGATPVWVPDVPLVPPQFMSRVVGVTGATTTAPMTLPAGWQPGECLVAAVSGSRGQVTAFTTAMPNWNKIGELWLPSGTTAGGILSIWAKFAEAGEPNPTWSLSLGNTTKTWMIERWAGVGALPEVVTPHGQTTTGAQTLVSNTVTAEEASVILTFLGLRAFAAGVDPVWGGGAVAAYNTDSGNIAPLYNATQQADSGSITHQAAFTNSQGAPAQEMGSIVLKPAA